MYIFDTNFQPLQFLIALLVLCTYSTSAQQQDPDPVDTYAITNVNVIPMDREQILEGQTVIIRGDRISTIGPSEKVPVPENVRIIDGLGKFLIPGLTEMHGHIPGADQPQYGEDVLFLYISNGVTTVRNMLGSAYHLELRDRINKGELLGPKIHAASPWLSRENIRTPQTADSVVRQYKEAGFDLLKIGNIAPPVYDQMARTAHEINMPFGGHIPEEVGLVGALEARQTSIDHFDRYVEFLVPPGKAEGRSTGFFGSGVVDLVDRSRIPEAIKLTLEAGTWNVPTLSLIEHLASPEPAEEMIERDEMRYMPKEVLQGWVEFKNDYSRRDDFQPEATAALVELRRELTRQLHKAGAPIALGSDAPQFFNVPGFSIHHEMQMMVNAGLSPYEVLETGTRNAAAYFGAPEEFGTIKPGRRADLILLEANPLVDISNVQKRAGVMVRGNWWPESEIQERLNKIEARVNQE